MKLIGTLTVRNELCNSRLGLTMTKPAGNYVYRVLERNESGDCLCVVFDGDNALGVADVAKQDAVTFTPDSETELTALFRGVAARKPFPTR